MLKSHDKFYSAHGKRLILIAEDEFINQELLGNMLSEEYDIIYASDGLEALNKIKEHKGTLSLVLLDLMMPVMNGMEVLQHIKDDPELQNIPVIVLTADQEAEVESLTVGAVDFIPKPYPSSKVIMARVLRTIELSEDRQIISSTERDPITGLYNKEFFYRYAEQYDQHHADMPMDAIVINVCHFHIINDRFGMTYGDAVLKQIGKKARRVVKDLDGIVCRREADTFMIYCPRGVDYKLLLEKASVGLSDGEGTDSHVRLRMGVYTDVDKSLDIVRRFDRAKMAADTLRGSVAKSIEIYDEKIRERELFNEQLIDDFHAAIVEKQFSVFFQPKFNITAETPVLSSAEALVRWRHPRLGMVSPGVFIPLFEDNGLIEELDRYVWENTAIQIRQWKDKFGFSVPVSVNVSRIDMYDPGLTAHFVGLVREHGIEPEDLLLEITESAYTDDPEQIINTINELRDCGFRIEMDDFGSGYSSLNMISTLPIDVLKLDMSFIRSAFEQGNGTRMIEVIIDIAGYLTVPVVAEGVETEDQMKALRAIGCDIVQGYYFSKPVPAEEFEPFLTERISQIKESGVSAVSSVGKKGGMTFSGIAHALSQDYFSIYYVDTETDWFIEYSSDEEYGSLGIEKSGSDFFSLSRKNISRLVFKDDRDWVLSLFTKDNLLRELKKNQSFTMTYRLVMDGSPTYVRMKASCMPDKNDRHIVIGVNNVDAEMHRIR